MAADTSALKSLLDAATARLSGVVPKRLFGCDGYFTDGNIFALVWKEGRIGIKLPDEKAEAELRGIAGAGPWRPGGKMSMSHWVLVPPRFHDEPAALAAWTRKAHALAVAAGPKPDGPRKARKRAKPKR